MKRLAKITSLIILVSVLLTVAVSAVPKKYDVNGDDVGVSIDCYGKGVAADYLYEIGEVTLKEGYSNSLKEIITGKNSSSSAYNMGIDFVLMVPVN